MMYFEGAISVKSAIENNKRKISRLLIDQDKHTKDFNYIINLAKQHNITILKMPRNQLDELSTSKSYGGILLECDQRNDEIFNDEDLNKDKIFIAYLQGIEDPYNVGYSLRTLYASGCDLVILPKRNWGDNEKIIMKSSAGAFDKLKIIDDDINNIKRIKELGVSIVLIGRKDAINLYDYQFKNKVMVVFGGAMRGINQSLSELAENTIFIPYANEFKNSLNETSAVAVISYEIYRQRCV